MKKSILTFCALFLAISMMAERVSEQDAALVAGNFLQGKVQTSALKKSTAQKPALRRVALQDEQQFYVYQNENGEGWVMIAANDVAHPVLAYSDKGQFRTDNMPKNMRWWFGKYSQCIAAAEADGAEQTAEVQAEWKQLRKGVAADHTPVVGPLVKTTWDQDDPYWNLCPGSGSDKAYTGCVATAMAQVMNYWQWPEQGTGSHSYRPHDPNDEENYSTRYTSTLSANFGATTYDWGNMLDSYSGSATTAQKTAVATLMYHCGVATEMMYGNSKDGGSGTYTGNYGDWDDHACAQNALWMNFGYKKSSLKSYMRDGYSYGGTTYYEKWSDADWTAMVKAELDLQHPIMYGGAGSGGGHSFICDGYATDNYFHFNWGWSGSNDGWYTLKNLVPGSGGAGGGSYSFSEDQDVIIGIEPDKPLSEDETTLVYTLTGVTRTGGTAAGTIKKETEVSATFTAANGYLALTADNTTVTATVGGTALTPTTAYNDATLTVTIPADKVTDKLVITVSATKDPDAVSQVYKKVTSAPADWSGTYLIVYETGKVAFNGGLSTLDAAGNTISVTISSDEIAITSATEAAEFTIAKSGSSYTIKSKSGKYIGKTADSNGLDANDSELTNAISLSGSDVNIVGSGGAYLRYNSNSGQERFRYYKSTSYTGQKAIQLYRKEDGGSGQGGDDDKDEIEVKVLDTAVGYYYADEGKNYWDVDIYNDEDGYPEVYITIPATSKTGINGTYQALGTWYGWTANDSIEGETGTFKFEYVGASDYEGFYSYHITGRWVADNSKTYYYDATVDMKFIDYDNGQAEFEPTGDINGTTDLGDMLKGEDTIRAVYDLLGRARGTSLEGLPAGVYIIRTDKGTQKVLVQ